VPTPTGVDALSIVAWTTPHLLRWIIPGLVVDDVKRLAFDILKAHTVGDLSRAEAIEKELSKLCQERIVTLPIIEIIVGSRGSGKTTLAEAVRYMGELAGFDVVYITSAQVLRGNIEQLKNRIHESSQKDKVIIILDDLAELLKAGIVGPKDILELLNVGLSKKETATTGTWTLMLFIQSEEDLLVSALTSILTQYVEEALPGPRQVLETQIFEHNSLETLLRTWYEISQDVARGLLLENITLETYRLRTRRGVFIDLDVHWHYYRWNDDARRQYFKNLVKIVNVLDDIPEEVEKDYINKFSELFRIAGYRFADLSRYGIGFKLIEKAHGGYARAIYNEMVSVYGSKVELKNELFNAIGLYKQHIDSLNMLQESFCNIDAFIDALVTVFRYWRKMDPVEPDYKLELIRRYRFESGEESKVLDAVYRDRSGVIKLAFIKVSAKPRQKKRGGISVQIPSRIKEILEMEELKKNQPCLLFIVCNKFVEEALLNEVLKYGWRYVDTSLDRMSDNEWRKRVDWMGRCGVIDLENLTIEDIAAILMIEDTTIKKSSERVKEFVLDTLCKPVIMTKLRVKPNDVLLIDIIDAVKQGSS